MYVINKAFLFATMFSTILVHASEMPTVWWKKDTVIDPQLVKQADDRIVQSLRRYAQKPKVAANISYRKAINCYQKASYNDAYTLFESINHALLPKVVQPSCLLYKMATALQLSNDQENQVEAFNTQAFNYLGLALRLFDDSECQMCCDLSILGNTTESIIQRKIEHIITTEQDTEDAYEWCSKVGRLYIKTPANSAQEKERHALGAHYLQYAAKSFYITHLFRAGCLSSEDLPLTASLHYLMTIDRAENNDNSPLYQIARKILTQRLPNTISEQYWLFHQYIEEKNYPAAQNLLLSIFERKIVRCNLDISIEEKNRLIQHCSTNAFLVERSGLFMESPQNSTAMQQAATAFLALVYCHATEPGYLIKSAYYLTQLKELPRFKILDVFLADVYYSLGLQAPNPKLARTYFVKGVLLGSANMDCFTALAKDLADGVTIPDLSDLDIARLLPQAPETPDIVRLRKIFLNRALAKKEISTYSMLTDFEKKLSSNANYSLLIKEEKNVSLINNTYIEANKLLVKGDLSLMNRLANLKHPHACLIVLASKKQLTPQLLVQSLRDSFCKGIVKKENDFVFIDGDFLGIIFQFITTLLDNNHSTQEEKRTTLSLLIAVIAEHGINMTHFHNLIKDMAQVDLEK